MSCERRNVSLILADELRADILGCSGHQICRTPNIDRMAQEGTRFSQAMVNQATCTPSRASILTGVYPSALGSRMVGCSTPDDPRFLPRVLGAAGHRTASIGKIHLVPQRAEPNELRTRQGDYYGFHDVDLVNGHGDRCFGNLYTRWLEDRVPDLAERRAASRNLRPGINGPGWRTLGPSFSMFPFLIRIILSWSPSRFGACIARRRCRRLSHRLPRASEPRPITGGSSAALNPQR